MLTCEGRFLGYVESSRQSKDGQTTYWTRTLDVNTKRGVETVTLTQQAWDLLHERVKQLKEYESQVLIAIEPKVGSEFVNFEKVPRVVLELIDFQVMSGPGKDDAVPRSVGSAVQVEEAEGDAVGVAEIVVPVVAGRAAASKSAANV